MPVFRYQGYDSLGSPVSGIKDADTQRALRSVLRKEGVFVTEVEETQGQEAQESARTVDAFFEKIRAVFQSTRPQVAIFTRQLAILLRSGIQLSEAFTILVDQTQQRGFKQVLADLKTKVNEGVSLSDAMKAHPRYFEELYLGMVSIGESTGNLDAILLRLADFLDNQGKLKGKVSVAFAYPTLMLVAIFVVVALLMVILVPQIQTMYTQANQELPWNTRLLIATSELFSGWYVFLILPCVVAVIYGVMRWKKSETGRLFFDRLFLKLPIAGPLVRTIAVSRFSRTLATLLASGVPVLRAMDIGAKVLGNAVLAKVIETAQLSIKEGESIALPLKKSKEFPLFVCQMIAVGERSGQLEYMLQNVASAYDLEVDQKMTKFLALLEPILFLFMAAVVGFVVLSVMIPLVSSSSLVSSG